MNKLNKKEYIINGVLLIEYEIEDSKNKHCEAVKDNCTGHGNTPFEALMDLEMKQRKVIIKLINVT
jgi:hypothetical protein